MAAEGDRALRRASKNGLRARRRIAVGTVLCVLSAGLVVTGAGPAFATSVPGTPGTPVAVGMQGAAALRWSAPGDVGSPPATRYRVEADDGSGWAPAPAEHAADAIAAGVFHTCAVLDVGTVKCWGLNEDGQLGLGDTAERGGSVAGMGEGLPAVDLGTGRTAVALAAGGNFTCAVLDDGSVKCWGDNDYGQLGLGDTTQRGDGAGEMGDDLPAVDLGTGRSAVALAAGFNHTCALLDDASVKCWGDNTEGQLGLGDTTSRGDGAGEMGDSLPAVALGPGRTTVAISAGGGGYNDGTGHSCALLDDRSVKCWGGNGSGQLGLGDTADRGDGAGEMGDSLPAVALGAGRRVVALAPGYRHSCALLDDATVKCWGGGGSGALGLGDTASRGDAVGEMGDSLPAVALGTGRTVVALFGGRLSHTCAVLDDGTLKCWGQNLYGELGLGDAAFRGDGAGEMGDSLPAVDLGAGRTAVALTAGFSHTCALLDDAAVKCWGYNEYGQLGSADLLARVGDGPGEMGDSLPPVLLHGPRPATALTAGFQHTCALQNDGTVHCWGDSYYGELGSPGFTRRRSRVVDLGTGRTAVAISAGALHTCALLDDATVKCWGDNEYGQLGLGDTSNRGDDAGEMGDSLPAVDLGTGRTAVAIGTGDFHTCAVLDNGALKCWGANGFGQLGLGNTQIWGDGPGEMGDNLAAVDLGTGRTATAISADYHTCAVLDDGTVKCWGHNGYGNLGLGDTANRGDGVGLMGDSLPAVDLGTGRTATEISVHHGRTCAVLDDGTVKCWGANDFGKLGLGNTQNQGDDVGEMGDSLAAVDLGTGRAAVAISAGEYHTCALLDDATTKCWGHNAAGELGQGDTSDRGGGAGEMGDSLATVDLGTGRSVVTIAAGDYHTCAVLDDDSVKCWGRNERFQLGLGDVVSHGDAAGEMGDSLPAVVAVDPLGGGSPPRTAVVRLAPGTYQLRVVALNSAGESAPSGASASVGVTLSLPAAPKGVVGIPGSGQIALTWVPASDGGSAFTDYEVSVFDGSGGAPTGVTGATTRLVGSPTASYTFTGLSNGTAYTFRVKALNAAGGTGPASTLSAAVFAGSPLAPTGVQIFSGSTTTNTGGLGVFFAAGANNGSAIINFTASCVSSNGGLPRSNTGSASPVIVTFASTAYTYTCTVKATNARGPGPSSAPSNSVILGSPAAPTGVSVVSGSTGTSTGSLLVTPTLGVNNGSAISSSTATCTSSDGGVTNSWSRNSANAGQIRVSALDTGKTYTCTVHASNFRGPGLESAPSAAVIVGSPAAPTGVKAVSGSAGALTGSMKVTFTIGADNGAAITSQTATCTSTNGGVEQSGYHFGAGAGQITVSSLTTGSTYKCKVKAFNARGAGKSSSQSPAVIEGSPAAPTGVTAVKVGSGQLKVTFTPRSANGDGITSFSTTCTSTDFGLTKTKRGSASPITVTSLTAGSVYTCTVKATNDRGTGLASAPSAPVKA